MEIKEYISIVNQKYRAGNATEHTYRGILEQLIQTLLPNLRITNEPQREKCGAPDYIASRRDGMPVFYIEAKNIGDNDLDGRNGHKEQFTRYKKALDYIIFTDYLDFHLYEHGEFVDSVRIAEIKGDKIVAIIENEEKFHDFIEHVGSNAIQSITSASRLAKLMAGKARLLENIIEQAMKDDTESYANENLRGQYQAFKDVLIQELKPSDFADIYAQTIAYGMFAARLHDDTPDDFSREEAARLIPKTNPFLRQIFNNLAGNDLDERIAWVVDDLVTVFKATNIQKVMKTYVQNKRHHDPMIHFYEDFLAEYNPKLRKSKGVWYTPQPVVGFIVRAVDEILQKDFNLPEGLADYSMIEQDVAIEQSHDGRTSDRMKHEKKKFHRVQILDPATGTGTFLAEVVNQIYDRYRDQQGIWQEYVEKHLLPRLNGFEILMASYAVAHLKLDMLLANTGYQHQSEKRLRVYLTNSLEESNNEPRTLFSQWLSREATEANVIKRDCPVMVMIGNPPYSISSQNKGEWISNLVTDYKKGLNEKKINIEDDYIKFIRLGQYYVEKNGSGLLAYISNNSFIDGITHRQMRRSLMDAFDCIYILDLHGNARKQEVAPDGSKDENVFDIMQGVSINIFVKTGLKKKGELATIYHQNIFGTRESKYSTLNEASLSTISWKQLSPTEPYYFFVPKDFSVRDEYERGFKVDELMIVCNSGIQTKRDDFVYQFTQQKIENIIKSLRELDAEVCRNKLSIGDDGIAWTVDWAKQDVCNNKGYYSKVLYRPFDLRWTYYTGKSSGFMARPRKPEAENMLKENIALLAVRNTRRDMSNNYFVANSLVDKDGISSFDNCRFFPLYVYQENMGVEERVVNFNMELYSKIAEGLNYSPCDDDRICIDLAAEYNGVLFPRNLFDYIYAILHSPKYRERYKEFLKIDFPRIPYPTDRNKFADLVEKGAKLQQLHLMEDLPTRTGINFPVAGSMQVDCYRLENNRVYINSEQYFDNVPESAWNFYIGGYQPAQKWLKDRKGMSLSFEDVKHYGRIIYILKHTEQIMQEIDKILWK